VTAVYAGNLVYGVDIDLAKMLEGTEEAQKQLENVLAAARRGAELIRHIWSLIDTQSLSIFEAP